jgi:membrane protease YdiL (CAAX protease family)
MAMHTSIGDGQTASPGRAAASGLTAAAVVCADLWLVWHGDTAHSGLRAAPPIIALGSYVLLFRGDRSSIGLRCRPVQDFRYWLIATGLIGAAIGSFILAAIATFTVVGRPLPIYVLRPDDFWPAFLRMCVVAPIGEEATYRLGLCTGAVPLLRPWGTIAVSGLVFGALHVLYGNPGPDNLIAGFFLGWAYLKSGTILVPIVLHSLGNLCVVLAQVAGWYWLIGAE